LWFALSAGLPILFCIQRLDTDYWYDEQYTLYEFVNQSYGGIVSDYSALNNYVAYTLLLKAYNGVISPWVSVYDSEAMGRLPSLLCAFGTLVMLFCVAQRLGGVVAAVIATAWLGMTQMFLNYAVQLLGYSVSMLLMTALMWIAVIGGNRGSIGWRAPLIVLLGAAFAYVLPTNLFLLVPLTLLALWQTYRTARWGNVRIEGAAWAGAWAIAAVCYLPIRDQVLDARGSGVVVHSWHPALAFYRAALHDAWPLVALCVPGLWLLMRRGRIHARLKPPQSEPRIHQTQHTEGAPRPKDARQSQGAPRSKGVQHPQVEHGDEPWSETRQVPPLVAIAVCLLVVPFVLGWILGVTPFARNFCPVLPPLVLVGALLMAPVLQCAVRRVRRSRRQTAGGILACLIVVGALLPWLVSYPHRLEKYRIHHLAEDGYFVYFGARFEPSRAVEYLKNSIPDDEPYLITYHHGDHANLVHYFNYYDLRTERPPIAQASDQQRWTVYYIAPQCEPMRGTELTQGFSPHHVGIFPVVSESGCYRVKRSNIPLEAPRESAPSPPLGEDASPVR
jgi:hypothetical protein